MSPASIISAISRNLRNQTGRTGFVKLAAAGGAVGFALTLAVGAGAAPSPVDPLAEVLGMNGSRGPDVSEAAQNAQAEAEDEDSGAQVGVLVSEAVCRVVSDETNLPENAQAAPGHANRDPEDCVHPSNAESQDIEDQDIDEQEGEDVSEDEAQADVEEEDENDNRGSLVSQAAHEAQAAARDAGEKVGPAVSEAVCRVNSDKTNLPEQAQDAPGHDNRDPENCTHPSNAGDDENLDSGEVESASHGNGNGHGRENAPGQQKKQSN
jgi:hypothetical protein